MTAAVSRSDLGIHTFLGLGSCGSRACSCIGLGSVGDMPRHVVAGLLKKTHKTKRLYLGSLQCSVSLIMYSRRQKVET